MVERAIHPLGGLECGELSPEGMACTKRNKHTDAHHVRGTHIKWWSTERLTAKPYDYYGDMSEGEWQAFGRYGY